MIPFEEFLQKLERGEIDDQESFMREIPGAWKSPL